MPTTNFSFLNRTKLPSEAFRCATCNAVSGQCEHTQEGRYEVIVCGIIKGYREPMDELIVLGPITPKPMGFPAGAIFRMKD
jgi:hypothetical protein